MHRVLAVIVVVLLVRTLPAQVVRLSPDEFSADVVAVDLFLMLDGTEGGFSRTSPIVIPRRSLGT